MTHRVFDCSLINLPPWHQPGCTLIVAQDRPIQAGDWVEAIREAGDGSAAIASGQRCKVADVDASIAEPWLRLQGKFGWWDARCFKRVDGPHPESMCHGCDAPPGYCEETCPVRPREPELPRTCATCTSPATTGDHCVYCAGQSRSSAETSRYMAKLDAMNGATARLLRGLASERARERVTAESRELGRKHPWEGEDE